MLKYPYPPMVKAAKIEGSFSAVGKRFGVSRIEAHRWCVEERIPRDKLLVFSKLYKVPLKDIV